MSAERSSSNEAVFAFVKVSSILSMATLTRCQTILIFNSAVSSLSAIRAPPMATATTPITLARENRVSLFLRIQVMVSIIPSFALPKMPAISARMGLSCLPSSIWAFTILALALAARSAAVSAYPPVFSIRSWMMLMTPCTKSPVSAVFSLIFCAERPRLSRILGLWRVMPSTRLFTM